MFTEKEQNNECGYAHKCSGIPFYPAEHSLYKKGLSNVSEEYVKSRERNVIKFLNKHGFDLPFEED